MFSPEAHINFDHSCFVIQARSVQYLLKASRKNQDTVQHFKEKLVLANDFVRVKKEYFLLNKSKRFLRCGLYPEKKKN